MAGALAGRDDLNNAWTLALSTTTVTTSFTYMDEIGGDVPMCATSFGSGTGTFSAAVANQAFGSYHNGTIPATINRASGSFEYGWRAVGTVMLFDVRKFTLRISGDDVTERTVMDFNRTQNGLNGAGVFLPSAASLAQVALDCVTGAQHPLTATVTWDFALNQT